MLYDGWKCLLVFPTNVYTYSYTDRLHLDSGRFRGRIYVCQGDEYVSILMGLAN